MLGNSAAELALRGRPCIADAYQGCPAFRNGRHVGICVGYKDRRYPVHSYAFQQANHEDCDAARRQLAELLLVDHNWIEGRYFVGL